MRRILAAALLVLGCEAAPLAPMDAAAPRDSSPGDGPAGDAPSQDAADARVGPAPLAPESTPEELRVPRWMIARLPSGTADEVLAAVDEGTFEIPEEGMSYGLWWGAQESMEDGTIADAPRGSSLYLAAVVELPEGRRAFAQADVVGVLYVNGAVQPGDVYGSGRIRVPLELRPGRNTLVLRAIGGRGRARVRIHSTPDELYLNTHDLTPPDLVAGSMDRQHLGLAVLNLTERPALDVTARVEASDDWEPSSIAVPSLPAGAVTQVPFELHPRRPHTMMPARVRASLRVESPSLGFAYRQSVELPVVEAGGTYRRTFLSGVDRSAQYFGVVPPRTGGPPRKGLVLALHGAGVEGIGHARAYSARDWTWVVAPTNRRPFGFDWEAFGRLDALEVLDTATRLFDTDPTRVYLTGHSMGGHGTWQLGVHFPGRFAAIGPSAGWGSFQSYVGAAAPRGAFARSQASSNTQGYLSNLARRGVYAIHGTADDNVPIREGRALVAAVRMFTNDVVFHEQPGAGHWWDGDRAPGADCVDWPPLFEFFQAHTLDPQETTFTYTSPGVWVNSRHAFVTLRSALDPMQDLVVTSSREGAVVMLTTRNVRSMVLDGAALRALGVSAVRADGRELTVTDGPIPVGPQDGKRPGLTGPFNEVFASPWCAVYDPEDPTWRRYAAYLTSAWSVIGNGAGCAVPRGEVTEVLRRTRNLLYLGARPGDVTLPAGIPFGWTPEAVTLGATRTENAALFFVFPERDERVGAVVVATQGARRVVFRLQPFTSSFAAPDWLVLPRSGSAQAGFFDGAWRFQAP
ncbi:MAG: prolyl oligopeptidase family serine peptidase [Deltaproteobacteria bacterium]|nr:prolyl oligopeptidase family serine peptidase [Deltaproteobacteria bacterium]